MLFGIQCCSRSGACCDELPYIATCLSWHSSDSFKERNFLSRRRVGNRIMNCRNTLFTRSFCHPCIESKGTAAKTFIWPSVTFCTSSLVETTSVLVQPDPGANLGSFWYQNNRAHECGIDFFGRALQLLNTGN